MAAVAGVAQVVGVLFQHQKVVGSNTGQGTKSLRARRRQSIDVSLFSFSLPPSPLSLSRSKNQ